jgi:hypothetical protein
MKVFAEKKFPCLHFISARIDSKTSLLFKEKKETNETFFPVDLPWEHFFVQASMHKKKNLLYFSFSLKISFKSFFIFN